MSEANTDKATVLANIRQLDNLIRRAKEDRQALLNEFALTLTDLRPGDSASYAYSSRTKERRKLRIKAINGKFDSWNESISPVVVATVILKSGTEGGDIAFDTYQVKSRDVRKEPAQP